VREALKQVRQSSDARVLLLTAEGRGFCAGQDLSDRNVAPGAEMPDLGESIDKFYNPLVHPARPAAAGDLCASTAWRPVPAPIPLACLVLAARSASFIQAFCKIGLVWTPAAPGCCRAWSAWPGPRPWPCWVSAWRRTGRAMGPDPPVVDDAAATKPSPSPASSPPSPPAWP
jgi:hypothetical protein